MATITKPMALDETLHTTESTPRRQADVLAGIQQAIREGFGQVASGIEYDNTTSGLTSDNVQGAVDEVKASLDVVEDDIASTQEVSGNPLTLTDAAPINAEKLEVVLEPKQDLHGQSYPYVGGAGKNKLPLTVDGIKELNTAGTWTGNAYSRNNITFTILTDSDGNVNGISVKTTGTASAATQFALADYTFKNATQYKLVGCPANGGGASYNLYVVGTQSYAQQVDSGNGVVFTPDADVATQVRIIVYSGASVSGVEFKPCVTTDISVTYATSTPYSNICPISGYDEVEVKSVGANTLEEDFENGYISNTGVENPESQSLRSRNYNKCAGFSRLYCVSKNNKAVKVCFYDASKTFIRRTDDVKNIAFDVPQNASFYKVSLNDYTAIGTTAVYNNDIAIIHPATVTTYEPYQSTTTSITFGQTVYGGSVDFLTGVLTVDMGYIDLGSCTYSNYKQGGFSTNSLESIIKHPESNSQTIKSYMSQYNKRPASVTLASGEFSINGNGTVFIVDGRFTTDATEFKTAMQGVQFAFELATPQTIQLTPAELKLLQGTNNITTNGTTINLGYQQNNVVGELKGEIEQAFYNHAMIYNLQSELTAVNMAYTDDYKGCGFDVPFIQEQHDYSTTPPTNWNIDLSACDIAVNGILPLYEDAQTGIPVESSKLIASIEQVQKKDDCFRVFVGFYNLKMTSSADDITNAIIILDITAFGKVLDSRTLRN